MDSLEPQPPFSALIFDWDGTLVDSEEANYQALQDTVSAHGGGHIPRDWFAPRTGTSALDIVRLLRDAFEFEFDAPATALAAERSERYLDMVPMVDEICTVTGIARRYKDRTKMAVSTGNNRRAVEATMSALNLGGLFDALVTVEDVDGVGKPAPDVFLRAAEVLGVEPASCIVYEDSTEGLAAAAAAGMRSISVRF